MVNKVMVEIVRMLDAMFVFPKKPEFYAVVKEFKLPQLLFCLITMDRIVVSNLFNVLKEFNYADSSLLKCILKFAFPNNFIPDLDPIFAAADKNGKQVTFKKQGEKARLDLKFKYDFNFIERKLYDSLKIEEIKDGDILQKMREGDKSPEITSLSLEMRDDGLAVDAEKFFKLVF